MVSSKIARSPSSKSKPARKGPAAPVTARKPPAAARKTMPDKAAAPERRRVKSTRAAPRAPSLAHVKPGSNGLLQAVERVSLGNRPALNAVVRSAPHHAVDLAPTFRAVFAHNRSGAAKLASAYAESVADARHHRELFQQAASTMNTDERRTLIAGYRHAGQARGVVHAIGQLPRAQGRTLMRDLLVKDDKSVDKPAMREVLYYLRDAGAQIKRLQNGQPPASRR